VQAFRAYQHELEQFKREILPALERVERGESGLPFDVEDIKRRGRMRLAQEGITE
jgi:hypothetical protein